MSAGSFSRTAAGNRAYVSDKFNVYYEFHPMIPCGCFIADLFLVQQEASAGEVTSMNKHRSIS